MELNAKKTKVMHVTKREKEELNIQADGQRLQQATHYKYLGSEITDDGKDIEEIKRRIGQAKAKFWENAECIRRNLNLLLKPRLLKTFVFSVIYYRCETWTINKDIARRPRAFKMWCYRGMLRISWTDRQTNEQVLERAGTVKVLLQEIIKRKIAYAGHVMKGSAGELPAIAIEGTVMGTDREEDNGENGQMI